MVQVQSSFCGRPLYVEDDQPWTNYSIVTYIEFYCVLQSNWKYTQPKKIYFPAISSWCLDLGKYLSYAFNYGKITDEHTLKSSFWHLAV